MEYDKPLFFQVMAYAASADRDVIDMVSGNPDWDPPAGLVTGLREYANMDGDAFQYPPSEGLTELRAEIAARRQVPPDQVIITNGAGEANYLAMAEALARDSGREVILTDPVYPYYAGKTRMLGADATYVAVDRDGSVDPDAIRDRASDTTACIVINSPNNPMGTVYPPDTIEELIDVAEANDGILISDEVYDHFDYTGRFTSALKFDSAHRIVTNSFSKSMAITGFRVGYGVYPPPIAEKAKTRHMLVNITASRPAQYAVLRALRDTDPRYYESNRQLIQERIAVFTESMEAIGATYTEPVGAFYLMVKLPDFPGTMGNVYELIDEAGVAGMPGEVFGKARAEWIRFALVTDRVSEAADRLRAYFG